MLGFVKQVAVFGAVVYVAMVAALFLFQRKLQYFPDARTIEPAAVGLADAQVIALETADGERLIAWYVPARDQRRTFVYFHGNAGSIAYRAERAKAAMARGFGVLLLSYRGYGGSTGKPSELGLLEDARTVTAYLKAQGLRANQLVYFGESLGSGVAVQLAIEEPPAAIILEAPFTSAAEVGARAYWWVPVRTLLKDKYDSLSRIGALKAPLLVIHGTADNVVPFELGRALFNAAPQPKQMIEIEGGAHSVEFDDTLWSKITSFLSSS